MSLVVRPPRRSRAGNGKYCASLAGIARGACDDRPQYVADAGVTYRFLGKKLAIGVVGAFGTNLVTDWSSAVNAEFAVTQATTNAPSWVDDSWRQLGMTVLGNTATERAVVERAAALKTMETADQQLANYKSAGESGRALAFKSCAKVLARGLTIKSTYDSLKQLQKIYKETEVRR